MITRQLKRDPVVKVLRLRPANSFRETVQRAKYEPEWYRKLKGSMNNE